MEFPIDAIVIDWCFGDGGAVVAELIAYRAVNDRIAISVRYGLDNRNGSNREIGEGQEIGSAGGRAVLKVRAILQGAEVHIRCRFIAVRRQVVNARE